MQFQVFLFVVCLALLSNNAVSRSSGGHGGGGHSSGGHGGGRGSSGARSAAHSRGGAFSSHHGSLSTTTYHGGNYYTPAYPYTSRNNFQYSLQTSTNPNIMYMPNGHLAVYSTSQPIYIGSNSNHYYFGRDSYYSHTTYIHTSSGSSYHASSNRRMCAAPLDKYIENKVPLDTSVSNSTEDEDFENNSTSLFDIFKNDSSTTTTTVLPSTTTMGLTSSSASPVVKFDFLDGQRPQEIVWSCPRSEICCYMDCCPRVEETDDTLTIVLICAFLFIAIAYVAWKLFKQHVLKPRMYKSYH